MADQDAGDLVWRAFRDNYLRASERFVQGHPSALLALCATDEPMHICGAFGGYECGADTIRERIGWAGEQFRDGTFTEDLVLESVRGDTAMTFAVETIEARIAGAAEPVRQVLRVTQIYRREPAGWRLAHRHADFMRPTSTAVVPVRRA